jgi:hypothetical protein
MVNLDQRIARLYWQVLDIVWAAAVICLPFTSFPLMWYLMGVVVAPLSAFPVFILILFWLIPAATRHSREPYPDHFLMVAGGYVSIFL